MAEEFLIAQDLHKSFNEHKAGEPTIIWPKDYDEARQIVENKDIAGFLAFPKDFIEGVLATSKAE